MNTVAANTVTAGERHANNVPATGKHTPGPWTITHDPDGSAAEGAAQGLTVIIEREDYEREDGDECGRHIAFCFGLGPTNDTQAVADYRLIAAAPDLLEALKTIMDAPSTLKSLLKARNAAASVIAKAEGRAE